jgi:peptidyl-prolyl cis-trans isomerase C
MNYRNLLPLFATILIISGCDQLQTSLQGNTAENSQDSSPMAESAAAPGGAVLATVNGSAITQDVLDVYTKTRKPQQAGGEEANSEETVLNELISLELMRQEGEKKGLASRPIVIALLDQQKRSALAGATISDFMQANQTGDEEARKVYDENMGSAGDEFNARHILVETQEEAVAVIARLDGGADFSELAKEKSTGPSGKNGGQLGWFAPGQMVKPFSDATAALETGSYTKEPVETQFGWHVIILDEKRELTPPPFEDVKDRLKLLIANQKLQAHMLEIRKTADIQITGE